MKAKNSLILIFLILSAIVLSLLVANLTQGVEYLKWLTWGDSIGFDTVNLNLSVIDLSFAFHMNINVLQVILITAAVLLFKKIR